MKIRRFDVIFRQCPARGALGPVINYFPCARGIRAAHCGVAPRLCSRATRRSARLALHRPYAPCAGKV